MALLDSLKKQTNVSNASISELNVDIPYCVLLMKEVDTIFGPTVTCMLWDDVTGGSIHVFLPKSIRIKLSEIMEYNVGNVNRVSLTYRGKNKDRSVIDLK